MLIGTLASPGLLALRHPVTVARQLATLSEAAPGQLILAVGVDEDRRAARERLARAMQDFYRAPYERFEKHSRYGTAAESARLLR